MSKIIGIDLGTTNSCVSVMEAGQPKVIPNAEGGRTTPSVVEPTKNLVGQVAKRQQVVNPQNTVYSIKRLIGKRFSDSTVQDAIKKVPYTIKANKNGLAVVEVEGKEFTPQEISAKILQKLKTDAEAFLGEAITDAVITVPAYFDDSQRNATKEAGQIAGLNVKRIINEPTAASLAYGLDKKANEQIAVYDLGGGTFDISVLEIGDGVFEVKSTNGDTYLGGDDFDHVVIDWLLSEFKKDQGVDLSSDRQAMQRLKDAAEKAKIELSSTQETTINIPYITADSSGPKHLNITLNRSKLEQLTDKLVTRSIDPCRKAVKDSKISVGEIDEIVLVGGQTRMPKIVSAVKEFFGKEPNKSVNPDEVVAIGAAIQAGVLAGEVKDILLLDVTPLTLGVETLGSMMTPLIERNTTIPTSKSQVFSTAADNQTSVTVHVLQGERNMAADNKSLGQFNLEGIPPAPRGIPQVEVSFDIDSNGILKVSAKDKASGKEQQITVQSGTGLSKEDVEKMIQDAKSHKEDDEKKKEAVEARNTADTLCYTAEKTLKEAGDKVEESLKKDVEEAVKKLRQAMPTAAPEELRQETETLSQKLQEVGKAMYAQQPQQNPPTGDNTPNSSSDDQETVEGEVVED